MTNGREKGGNETRKEDREKKGGGVSKRVNAPSLKREPKIHHSINSELHKAGAQPERGTAEGRVEGAQGLSLQPNGAGECLREWLSRKN